MGDPSIFAMLDGIDSQARPQDSGYFTQPSHEEYERPYDSPSRQGFHSFQPASSLYARRGNPGTPHSYGFDELGPDISFDKFGEDLYRR